MKQLLCLLVMTTMLVNVTNAQTVWKDKVIGKWKYEGTEEFGVLTVADSLHKNNTLQFNADGTYVLTENGKVFKGTYKIDETAKTLTTSESGGKSKLYYLKKSDPGVLIVETQTPDLVRTRHRYTTVQ